MQYLQSTVLVLYTLVGVVLVAIASKDKKCIDGEDNVVIIRESQKGF